MNAPEILSISTERRIAYHRTGAEGDGANLPGIVFLGGFNSDMTGIKATWLEKWAQDRGRAYLRFDYRGHGASSGRFEDGCIGDWADDAAEALMQLTSGPQILVGSSMGGWIATLLAKRYPDRIAGLIGIAAAPDFTADRIEATLTAEQKDLLDRDGQFPVPSQYDDEPYVITRRLIEDGHNHLVLRAPLALPFPVRLLHGTADVDVSPDRSIKLLEHMDCPDARLTLVKGADHRFSEPRELTLIGKTLHGLMQVS